MILYYDLMTRNGQRCIEVREASDLGSGLYASPKNTVYSCSYSTQTERNLAFRRAIHQFPNILHYQDGKHNRAYFQ